MRHLTLTIIALICALTALADDYSVTSAGIGQGGRVMVNVLVNTKKDPKGTANDLLLQNAVTALMLHGIPSIDGKPSFSPIVTNAATAEQYSTFFEAFNREQRYRTYATVVPTSVSVMKNKSTKMYETVGIVVIDKEALAKYLEECGIVSGFNSLW